MQEELAVVKLTKKEQKNIPIGFRKIFYKSVMDNEVKEKLTIRSIKYNKITLEAYRPQQPISKVFDV